MENNNYQTIGSIIKRERLKVGLSVAQLSQKTKINESTLFRIEAETRNPSQKTLNKLMKVLPIDYKEVAPFVIQKNNKGPYIEGGNFIALYQLKKTMQRKELALLADAPEATLKRIEDGYQKPSDKLADKLCEVLEIEKADLLNAYGVDEFWEKAKHRRYTFKKGGEEIRQLRIEKKITAEKLAEISGLSLSSIYAMENGRFKPSKKFEEKINKYLKTKEINESQEN